MSGKENRAGKQGHECSSSSAGSVAEDMDEESPAAAAAGHRLADVVVDETAEQRIARFRKQLTGLHQDATKNEYCHPFMKPVDVVGLQLDDYLDKIKDPMDLETMGQKIEDGAYDSDPWLYVQDLELMVQNAVEYNGPKMWVAQYGQQLVNLCQKYINQRFLNMGFCCGRRRVFRIRDLACYAKPANECNIEKGQHYGILSDSYSVCINCYSSDEDSLFVFTNQNDPEDKAGFSAQKKDFVACVNDKPTKEPTVTCRSCGRRMHVICVRHLHRQTYDGQETHAVKTQDLPYTCFNCTQQAGPTVTSADIVPCLLSDYIEKKVALLHKKTTKHLTEEEVQSLTPVRVRVLSTGRKECQVKQGMRELYSESEFRFPTAFPFRSKAIFAFQQKADGTEVVIFGFHVNEYADDAPPPNSRRVYLSYLDSVNFFEPKSIRTITFHEILLSYFNYVRCLGFRHVSIWSCPPAKMDDYVFYAHPTSMRFPTGKRLKQWYERLLDKGVAAGCISFHTDISRRAFLSKMSLITQLPYMDGDLWPQKLEDAIKTVIEQESARRMAQAQASPTVAGDENQAPAPTATQSARKNKVRGPLSRQPKEAVSNKGINEQINDIVLNNMKAKVDVFFDISLCDEDEPLRQIVDVDPDLNCPLMDGREAWLRVCRTEYCEFSDIRMATHSTIRMLDIVLQSHVKEAIRYADEVLHSVTCRTPRCPAANCARNKLLLARHGDQPLTVGPKPTGWTNRQMVKKFVRECFNHHALRCDRSCSSSLCKSAHP